MKFHHLLRTFWQLLMLRKGRDSFLHRCKSREAPGDDPIPMQIQATLCAVSDFFFLHLKLGENRGGYRGEIGGEGNGWIR